MCPFFCRGVYSYNLSACEPNSDRRQGKKMKKIGGGVWPKSFPGRLLLGIALGSSLAVLTACAKGAGNGPPVSQGKGAGRVPIKAAMAGRRTIPVQLKTFGAVVEYTSVKVKSQVNGEIIKVYFKEGEDVKAGDILFSIDPRLFDAALKLAQAALAKDTSLAKNAESEERRGDGLLKNGVINREQYEALKANAEAAGATTEADRANIENAKINLEYCTIRSPIDGRAGEILTHLGNLVKGNDTPHMVQINQIEPIYVSFSVPEDNLSEIKKYMAKGKLKVQAIIPDDPVPPCEGEVTFLDNSVDNTTGTIRLKATFSNGDRRLWPGRFVNVVLTLYNRADVVVIPDSAAQVSQAGRFVFVVKDDKTVEMRPVALGTVLGDEVIVEKGINAGETVVTDGQLRLVAGAAVEIKTGGAKPAASQPGTVREGASE